MSIVGRHDCCVADSYPQRRMAASCSRAVAGSRAACRERSAHESPRLLPCSSLPPRCQHRRSRSRPVLKRGHAPGVGWWWNAGALVVAGAFDLQLPLRRVVPSRRTGDRQRVRHDPLAAQRPLRWRSAIHAGVASAISTCARKTNALRRFCRDRSRRVSWRTVGSKVPVARDLDIGAGPGELFVGKTFGF